MKTLYHLLTLVMGLILFVSCDKESEVLQNPEEKILKIQVTDKGYASDPANKETKAIDEEFNTTFENGDKIGVFIVDEDGSITYANVPVTLKDNVWVDETQGVRIKSTTARVFAYYPYVEDSKINDLVSPEAGSASDFFAGYINSLDISDQSTLSRYRQADVLGCMVKKASISEGTITFKMLHLMGLVVLDFSKVLVPSINKYTLTTDPTYQWERKGISNPATITELKIGANALFDHPSGYRYLLKPGSGSITATFKANGEAMSFSILSVSLQSGFYKSFQITGEVKEVTVVEKTHKLKIGDIFKRDGGLISQEELASPGITEEEKAECVGVVYYVGDAAVTDTQLPSDFNHGLVVALTDGDGSTLEYAWQSNYNSSQSIAQWVRSQGTYIEWPLITNKEIICGYSQTEILKDYTANNSSYPVTILTLLEQKEGKKEITTAKTSGWYIPSLYELKTYIYNNKGKIEGSLDKLSGNASNFLSSVLYLSSGESSIQGALCMNLSGNGTTLGVDKKSNNSVRFVLAF